MAIIVLDTQFDEVIKSQYITAKVSYEFAFSVLVPLIDRLEQQRYTLRPQFYNKLEKDIKNGCIMPPLTLAIKGHFEDANGVSEYANAHVHEAFVLDGIQRLSTIKRIGKENLDLNRPLYINILVCESMDRLLYRMITLNNGQKPMSARHQVEILADNLYDFEALSLPMQTEKQSKKQRVNGCFKKEDIIKAYLAFISGSVNIDNQKIIESKLDELITDQIIESDIPERLVSFSEVVNLIQLYVSQNDELLKWFRMSNNLIGFAAGINKSYVLIKGINANELAVCIDAFEKAFSFLDVSKIKLGLARRKGVQYFIENYNIVNGLSVNQLTDKISQVV